MGLAEGMLDLCSVPRAAQLTIQDQQHLKLHLPERMVCFVMSPNRVWVAGGSQTGQVYLWEVRELVCSRGRV